MKSLKQQAKPIMFLIAGMGHTGMNLREELHFHATIYQSLHANLHICQTYLYNFGKDNHYILQSSSSANCTKRKKNQKMTLHFYLV